MKGRSVIAMFLAYLLPGAGHWYLGRRGRAVAYFLIVTLMFVIGIAVDGELYALGHSGGSLLRMLASLGTMGAGVLYFAAQGLGAHGDITSITYEYGTAFAITAGLMNLLLVLDAYDIAEGRKE